MLSELIVHRGMGGGTNIASNEKKESLSKQEIGDILKFGAENLFREDEEGQGNLVFYLFREDEEGQVTSYFSLYFACLQIQLNSIHTLFLLVGY